MLQPVHLAAVESQVTAIAHAIAPPSIVQAEAFWSAAIAVALVVLTWVATWFASRHESLETRRFWRMTFRHIAVFAFVVAMVVIWRHQIHNSFLAFGTALAGLLLTLRENWMSLTAFWLRLGRRQYGLDDFIEIDGIRGRVQGISWLSTAVAETAPGTILYTGRVVHVPNHRMLLAPLYVANHTGDYSAHLLVVTLPKGTDALAAERLLLAAAHTRCAPHLADAARHMARLQHAEAMDTPSVEPKLLMNISDGVVKLTLRFVARADEKQKLEQAILRDFMARAGEAGWPGQPTAGEEAGDE